VVSSLLLRQNLKRAQVRAIYPIKVGRTHHLPLSKVKKNQSRPERAQAPFKAISQLKQQAFLLPRESTSLEGKSSFALHIHHQQQVPCAPLLRRWSSTSRTNRNCFWSTIRLIPAATRTILSRNRNSSLLRTSRRKTTIGCIGGCTSRMRTFWLILRMWRSRTTRIWRRSTTSRITMSITWSHRSWLTLISLCRGSDSISWIRFSSSKRSFKRHLSKIPLSSCHNRRFNFNNLNRRKISLQTRIKIKNAVMPQHPPLRIVQSQTLLNWMIATVKTRMLTHQVRSHQESKF